MDPRIAKWLEALTLDEKAALVAGVTMVQLLAAIEMQPENAGALFIQAMRDLCKSVNDIL